MSCIRTSVDLRKELLGGHAARRMSEGEFSKVDQFVDFLHKALNLNPEKRLSVEQALAHPFIVEKVV